MVGWKVRGIRRRDGRTCSYTPAAGGFRLRSEGRGRVIMHGAELMGGAGPEAEAAEASAPPCRRACCSAAQRSACIPLLALVLALLSSSAQSSRRRRRRRRPRQLAASCCAAAAASCGGPSRLSERLRIACARPTVATAAWCGCMLGALLCARRVRQPPCAKSSTTAGAEPLQDGMREKRACPANQVKRLFHSAISH